MMDFTHFKFKMTSIIQHIQEFCKKDVNYNQTHQYGQIQQQVHMIILDLSINLNITKLTKALFNLQINLIIHPQHIIFFMIYFLLNFSIFKLDSYHQMLPFIMRILICQACFRLYLIMHQQDRFLQIFTWTLFALIHIQLLLIEQE
ncbi:hypothetical protein IMG5_182230 [Ichthyophthirius multifiliis]|uniref:Transmembrane protein n=1 Tax=Ichthyophthirius multifiliis TaxID=5932 RepID=G0R307_ICHMU|nr:hypothetical protein IMG5_182230 [Ichthyophthirius multifiliis]EGR28139.1 hypothetical protein IMG5_182230 [Ichthyophthirius multifiliis]|eukprot:XP_004027484.1 hypothetical protein IMG5_182230 [Ichthyophthirius multifiliis]